MADPGVKCRQIGEGVNLFSEASKGPPALYKYYIEPIGFNKITFTFNFEGSKNFELCDVETSGELGLQAVVIAKPFEKSNVVTCRQANIHKGGSLSMSMSWVIEEPDEESCAKYLMEFDQNMKRIISEGSSIFPPSSLPAFSKQDIEDICKRRRISFLDASFPPTSESLFKVDPTAVDETDEHESAKKTIVWRRPKEFMSEGAPVNVFDGTVEPNDIKQGQLGDCWLMCSFASIAEYEILVYDLFPDEYRTPSDEGVYKVRLCKNGIWQEVQLDDYFPCYPEGGPIYSRAHDNELWVLLLEKAFAKINGSYAAIKSGWPFEAMIDLTGAPYRDIRFSEPANQEKIREGTLWEDLLHYDLQGYIMSCSTGGVDTFTESGGRPAGSCGLVPGHAYTLISAKETSRKDRLVKLRNPWGSMEWNGNWSDESNLWTPELQHEVGFQQADDGIFWMSFDDLINHFVGINVCMVKHQGINKDPWNEARKPFEYRFSPIGLGCISVPKYELIVDEDEARFYASVHQQDKRCIGAPEYIDFGVTIMRQESDGSLAYVASSGNSVERQNQIGVHSLPKGKYVVIPTSTGCKVEQFREKKLNKGLTIQASDLARTATLVIHCTSTFGIREITFHADTYESAMDLPVINEGSEMDLFGDGSVMLYTRKSAYAGLSYVARNQTERDAIVLSMDFAGSENIISHRGKLVADIAIPPGHAKVLHHIAPADDCKDWAVGWSCNARWITEEEMEELSEKEITVGF